MSRSRLLFGLLLVVLAPWASAEPPVTITHQLPADFVPPSAPVATDPALLGALDRLDVEAAIRQLYDQFTAMARRVGKDITFSLSNFKTYRASQFDELPASQVRRVHGGPRLRVSPSSFHGDLPSQFRLSYEIEWVQGQANAEEANHYLAGLSVAEALRLEETAFGREGRPAFVGLSSFSVEVKFEGKTVSFLETVWWGARSPESLHYSMGSEVANPYSLEDPGPEVLVVPLEELRPPRLPALTNQPNQPLASCVPVVRNWPGGRETLSQPDGHTTGGHSAILSVDTTCEATRGCTSSCTPSPRIKFCDDTTSVTSPLSYYHQPSTKDKMWSNDGLGAGLTSECGWEIESYLAYLPRCCCGTEFCT